MTRTHTPEPWTVGESYNNAISIRAKYGIIAEVKGQGPVSEANARLIAAAPELLRFVQMFAGLQGEDVYSGDVADAKILLQRIEGSTK